MSTLGSRLRALRQQAGLSQAELAAGLVTKSMISQIESDKARPSRDLLTALARRLGVPLEHLLPVQEETQKRLAGYKQAQAFLSLGEDREALPLLLECLQTPFPGWPQVELAQQTAECLYRLERYEEARSYYEMALRFAIRDNREADTIRIRFGLGQAASAGGHRQAALHEWMHAFQDLQKSDAPDVEPELFEDICLQMAHAFSALHRGEEAVRFYEEARRRLQERGRGPIRKQAEIAQGLGGAFAGLQRHQEADAQFGEAERLYAQVRDRRRLYEVKAERVALLRKMGREQEAIHLLEQSLAELAQRDLPEQRARLFYEQALLERAHGRQEQALFSLHQALTIGSRSEVFHGRVHLLCAEILVEQQRWRCAREQAERARALLEKSGAEVELLHVYEILIHVYKHIGDYRQASDCVAARNELQGRRLLDKGWVL